MRRSIRLLAPLLTLFLAASCGDSGVQNYTLPKDEAGARAPEMAPPVAGAAHGGSELSWTAPEGWVPTSATPMKLAAFAVPQAGECYLMILGGEGGGLVGNVNRWRGQIGLPAQSSAEIKASAKQLKGRLGPFLAFRIENPAHPERAILAAILPLKDRTAFVKLNTPAHRLDAVEGAFDAFCSSIGPADSNASGD